MTHEYVYCYVQYHSHQWQLLVSAGWMTDIVVGGEARMIRRA
jgi:hypothetical protein